MPRYFAYGSNMASHRLRSRLGKVEIVGVAVLSAYRHEFSKHGSDGTAKGNIEPHEAGTVWGVVYEISVEQLVRLDVVEGGYRQIEVTVERQGRSVTAITYIAIAPDSGLEPAAEYIEFYEDGVREHDIPIDYWHSIRPKRPAGQALVAVEVGAVIAITTLELPVPKAALLLILASASLWARGRSWLDAGLQSSRLPGLAVVGLLVGAMAQIVISQAAGIDSQDAALGQARMSDVGIVVLLQVAAAFAIEMVFRGYLFERVAESVGSVAAGIGVSAALFAWVVAGTDVLALAAAAAAGIGYSLLYLAGNRTLVLPIAVHIGFEVTGTLMGALG